MNSESLPAAIKFIANGFQRRQDIVDSSLNLLIDLACGELDLILSSQTSENSTKRSGHHFTSWYLFRLLAYRVFEKSVNRISICFVHQCL